MYDVVRPGHAHGGACAVRRGGAFAGEWGEARVPPGVQQTEGRQRRERNL
ncbi:hypothetical protein [Acidihalobacter ferrooxydans]|nr:hypothetical protein [Acidihalobacter ferrooxydans]